MQTTEKMEWLKASQTEFSSHVVELIETLYGEEKKQYKS